MNAVTKKQVRKGCSNCARIHTEDPCSSTKKCLEQQKRGRELTDWKPA